MMTDIELAIMVCLCSTFILVAAGIQFLASRSRRPWVHFQTRLGVNPELFEKGGRSE